MTVCSPPVPELPRLPETSSTPSPGGSPRFPRLPGAGQPNRQVVSWSGPIACAIMGPIASRGRDRGSVGAWTWKSSSGTASRSAASSRARCGWRSGPAAAAGIGAAAQPGPGRAAERVPRRGGETATPSWPPRATCRPGAARAPGSPRRRPPGGRRSGRSGLRSHADQQQVCHSLPRGLLGGPLQDLPLHRGRSSRSSSDLPSRSRRVHR